MEGVPGAIPDPTSVATLLAAEDLVVGYFTSVDGGRIAAAASLYTDDARFLGECGREAIRLAMERWRAANASVRSRHVIANLRSTKVGQDTVVVRYTALAYTLDSAGGPALRSVLDQEMTLVVTDGRSLRIADHRIFGFDPTGAGVS